MMPKFIGKSIIVTGGSRGMGRACCERLASVGGKVLVVANDRRSVEEAVAAIGANAAGFVGMYAA
jgi:NAD(P)-dependent dehydrogenase (short-subunit alcohol dehydrogenase family)